MGWMGFIWWIFDEARIHLYCVDDFFLPFNCQFSDVNVDWLLHDRIVDLIIIVFIYLFGHDKNGCTILSTLSPFRRWWKFNLHTPTIVTLTTYDDSTSSRVPHIEIGNIITKVKFIMLKIPIVQNPSQNKSIYLLE